MVAFCDEPIERGSHGIDRLPVNVVLQDDGTRACPSKHPLGNRRSSRMFPIQGVHRPINDVELEPLRDPDVFRLVKRTVRRPQQNRRDSARGANGVLSLFDLIGGTIVGELRELWVIPGVVTNFAPLGDYPANQFRVSLDILAIRKKVALR